MMKNSRLEKDKQNRGITTKDVRNLFRLKNEIDGTTIKDIKKSFLIEKRKWSNQRQNNHIY